VSVRKNGKNCSPKRKRTKTVGDKRKRFLAVFSIVGNVRHACEIAGCSVSLIYELLREGGQNYSEEFKVGFDAAKDEAIQRLEQEMRRRAVDGCQRLKFDRHGQMICIPHPEGKTEKRVRRTKVGKRWTEEEIELPVMVPYVEHEYSDTLMIFLAKSLRPEVYRENVHLAGRVDSLNGHLVIDGPPYPSKQELIEKAEETLRLLKGEQSRVESGGSNGSQR
jgi:hypothetical protein